MDGSFFTVDQRGDADRFRTMDTWRGPWAPDAGPAGPPTGLLERAARHLALARPDTNRSLLVDDLGPVGRSRRALLLQRR